MANFWQIVVMVLWCYINTQTTNEIRVCSSERTWRERRSHGPDTVEVLWEIMYFWPPLFFSSLNYSKVRRLALSIYAYQQMLTRDTSFWLLHVTTERLLRNAAKNFRYFLLCCVLASGLGNNAIFTICFHKASIWPTSFRCRTLERLFEKIAPFQSPKPCLILFFRTPEEGVKVPRHHRK